MFKLVQNCLVPGCESRTDNPDVLFFNFPVDSREKFKAWNKALGFRANCTHIPDPKICERHFLAEEIDRSVVPVRLTDDAYPSVEVAAPLVVVPRSMVDQTEPIGSASGNCITNSAGEANYCRLCAKMERQPLKNSIEKMMRCNETAKLLGICLETTQSNEKLPAGVCDACSHMMKFLIKFVKSCCTAQTKLVKIFNDQNDLAGGLKLEAAENESVHPSRIKKEDDCSVTPGLAGLPTDYLEIGLEKEEKILEPDYMDNDEMEGDLDDDEVVHSTSKTQPDVNVKIEPHPKEFDSEYEASKEFPGSSASDSEPNSEYDDDYDPEEEKPLKLTEEEIKEDDEDVAGGEEDDNDEKPLKKRGRPRIHPPRLPKGDRKPRVKREKKAADEKPASLSKQICQICGKILSSSATFNVHMMTHTQQKDIVCPICDKRFYVKQQLKIHMESIHEKKDFVCSICGLKCRWRKSLRRHMLLHEDNPYKHKCTYCDKAFARPNQLRYHVMKHTGDRVYCEICGADYRFNYMLTQHKIRKHGIVFEGVQLYKQSARKKKSEGGESNVKRSHFTAADQQQQPVEHIQQIIGPQAAVELPLIAKSDFERTSQSDMTHVSELGSPATTASFTTIASPEPTQFSSHPPPHSVLDHQHQHAPPAQIDAFSGPGGINMSIPHGLIGFPCMNRQ